MDLLKKMDKQLSVDEMNTRDQLQSFHSAIEAKVDGGQFEDSVSLLAAVTRGMAKLAQVIGLFPGPRFEDDQVRLFVTTTHMS